jgi:hypothetical protein
MSSSPLPAAVPGCEPYRPVHHVRLVTAASLFDGHDAAINIMRRLLQATGAEVIHLGHNRSVREIVDCAIQEDAQGIALTSYQGGHLEFLQYMHDLVAASRAAHPDLRRRRRHHPAGGDRAAARVRHRARLLARRRARHGPAGHDQRSDAPMRLPGGRGAGAGQPGAAASALPERDPRAHGARSFRWPRTTPTRAMTCWRPCTPRRPPAPGCPCWASPAPAAPASRHWSTSWCAASSPTGATARSRSSRSILRAQDAAAAPCSATASA